MVVRIECAHWISYVRQIGTVSVTSFSLNSLWHALYNLYLLGRNHVSGNSIHIDLIKFYVLHPGSTHEYFFNNLFVIFIYNFFYNCLIKVEIPTTSDCYKKTEVIRKRSKRDIEADLIKRILTHWAFTS